MLALSAAMGGSHSAVEESGPEDLVPARSSVDLDLPLTIQNRKLDADTSLEDQSATPTPTRAPTPATPTRPQAQVAVDAPWKSVTVRPGDSLARIFQRHGISDQLQAVIAADPAAEHLSLIRPDEQIRLMVVEDRLSKLEYEIDNTRILRIEESAEGMVSSIEKRPYEIRTLTSSGVVHDSLFTAGKMAGLSDHVIMELVAIFAWDVDFALDIRQGDHFTVVHEQYYREGEMVGEGEIRAAEFVSQGKSHRAFLYTTSTGRTDYFSPEGSSLQKQFIRTPVSVARISSRFNLRRKHPVLNRVRAHKGVDYAAPTGTPIKATADGKVLHVGRKGGYGRTVILSHGDTYTTLYAHMSRYARGVKKGRHVKQGQTIGYIGKSGLATGPHLHYEFRVNGVHRNPLTVKFPQAQSLPGHESDAFVQATADLRRLLNEQQPATSTLAMNTE